MYRKKLIYIFNQKIDKRNIERFCLKKIDKYVKELRIINFYKENLTKNKFINSKLIKINFKSILKLIKNSNNSYYVDLSNKTFKELLFLKILSLAGHKRITFDVGRIPLGNTMYKNYLKNNLNNNEFMKFFFNIFRRFFYKIIYLFLLPRPNLAFTSGIVGKKLSKSNGSKKIIESHNLDYDNFIKIKKKKIIKKNFAVYVDQDFANNDDLNSNNKKFSNKNFENKIKYFLNDLNQKIINVRIAGGNRRRIKKKLFNIQTKYSMTDVMIAQSKLVIGHTSTALQYAILFEKPILLISCNEFKKIEQIHKYIINLKEIIGCQYLDIDNLKLKKISFKINKDKYDQYKKNYIKTKPYDNKTFFEIFKKNLSI